MNMVSSSTLRLLDAATNRAGEAARVVEDYARFVLDDVHLTELSKHLRHDLADVLATLGRNALCASRDTIGDVGCDVTTLAETQRSDACQVCVASLKRLEQSLRSLEEYSKLFDTEAAARFEQLRYRTYTLEKAICTTECGRDRLAEARLCVLVDARDSLGEFENLIAALVAAGVDMLQFRDKTLDDRAYLERATAARKLTADSETLLIMNDRAAIAAIVAADGLHVGQDDLSVRDARSVVGPEMLIGVSTSSIEMARSAVLDGANYIGIGPVFPSATKHFDTLQGTHPLEQVSADVSLPAFAIGGIDSTNLEQVLATGVERVAVSQAVVGSVEPANAARELIALLRKSAAVTT